MGKLKFIQGVLMAFDLKGVAPNNYDGEWIRFNIWSWHRIWRSIVELFPEEKNTIKLWYVNSNELVDREACERIADKIEYYGTDKFAQYVASLQLPVQQESIGARTLFMAYVFEMPAFIAFLRSCNGFYLK